MSPFLLSSLVAMLVIRRSADGHGEADRLRHPENVREFSNTSSGSALQASSSGGAGVRLGYHVFS
jgi:hypothetical protein